jgi:hypothetical protein
MLERKGTIVSYALTRFEVDLSYYCSAVYTATLTLSRMWLTY